ncbi:MAG TPA: Hsp70 family protein, partial [Acidimicrobiales bacterium]|nr:Hsp70 family protein [Acidimicrobiales bacterium]
MTYALGIDLGTTYTSVALARGGRAEVVALGYRATAVPTVVVLTEDGRLLVGDAAERRAVAQLALSAPVGCAGWCRSVSWFGTGSAACGGLHLERMGCERAGLESMFAAQRVRRVAMVDD